MRALKYLFYLLFFIYSLLLFLPKAELYYQGEKFLTKKDLYINDETVKEKLFGLDIKNAKILYESLMVSSIKEADINIFLIYNTLHLKGILLKTGNLNFIPKKIKTIDIHYSLKDFRRVHFIVDSDIGEIKGNFDLIKQKAVLTLAKRKGAHSKIFRYFKKDKKGIFRYEKNFKLY